MATRDVFDRHLRHQLDGDLDAILSDYAPGAVVATPAGIGSGHDQARSSTSPSGATATDKTNSWAPIPS